MPSDSVNIHTDVSVNTQCIAKYIQMSHYIYVRSVSVNTLYQ